MPRKTRKLARKNRRAADRSLLVLPGAVNITGAAVSTPTTTALMTFSGIVQPTSLTAQSKITLGGAAIVSVTPVSPTVLRLTGAGSLTGAAYVVPETDPAIRTPAGGFVTAKSGTF